MKLLYVGDDSDRINWGCRATSAALRELLAREHDVIAVASGKMIEARYPVSNRLPKYERPHESNAFLFFAKCIAIARETAPLLEQGDHRRLRGLAVSKRLAAGAESCIELMRAA